MSTTAENNTRIVGRGCEATVYLDKRSLRAEKRFDRAPIKIARSKAKLEFARLNQAWIRSSHVPEVHVPAPHAFDSERASYTMGYVEDPPLLTSLLEGSLPYSDFRTVARHVSNGMKLFVDLQADCTLDHILIGSDLATTFLDFGIEPGTDFEVRPDDLSKSFAEVVGSTVYESSRISRVAGLSSFIRCALFLGILEHELDNGGRKPLFADGVRFRSIQHAYRKRIGSGSILRRLWYRTFGLVTLVGMVLGLRYGRIRFSKQAASTFDFNSRGDDPSKAITRLHTVFSFVWDFPKDTKNVNNGVHRVVDGLMDALGRKGIRPVALSIADKNDSFAGPGYRVERFGARNLFFANGMVERIHESGRDTTTILNGVFNLRNSLLGLKLRRKGLSYFISPHSVLDKRFFGISPLKKWIYWHLIEKAHFNGADGVIAMGENQDHYLELRGVSTPVFPTRNGICRPVYPAIDRYTRSGTVRFHFFGRIDVETKGLDLLIQATRRVAEDHDIEVVVQGPDTGGLEEVNRLIRDLKLEDTVVVKDPDTENHPSILMSEYDVCILSSRYEGYPTAIVEALVAARPVVSTRVGGLAPLMEEAGVGIIVAPSVDGIEAGMRRAIASRKDWPKMGREGRQFAQKNLDWNVIANDLLSQLEVYRRRG